RAWKHFVSGHGMVAVTYSCLVVAHSHRQQCALHGGDVPFLARVMGALSATTFSLLGSRDHSAPLGPEHSIVALRSLRRGACERMDVRNSSLTLPESAVRLLGVTAAHDCSTVYPADG